MEVELGDLGPKEWVLALFCQKVIGQYISSPLPQFLSCESGDKNSSCFIGPCGDLFIVHLSSYLLVPTTCQAEPQGYSWGQSPDPVAPWLELWSGWDALDWYICFSCKIHQYHNRVPEVHWGALGVSRSGEGKKWWAEAGVAGAERRGSPVPCEAGWEKAPKMPKKHSALGSCAHEYLICDCSLPRSCSRHPLRGNRAV